MNGTYSCAKCGDWTSFDAEFIDFGSHFTCEKCGEKTVFALCTIENYPRVVNAMSSVATQQNVASDAPRA